jgi:hypothetical protein
MTTIAIFMIGINSRKHSSNDLPWRLVPRHSLLRISTDSEGFVDLKELDALLCAYNQKCVHGKQRIRLVAVSGASNVLAFGTTWRRSAG